MDASWPRSWPEMAELHVFDPEGDVLLVLKRCHLEGHDLVEPPESHLVSETGEPRVEDELPPPPEDVPDWSAPQLPAEPELMAGAPDWPEPQPKSVSREPQTEISEAETNGVAKPENSASASLVGWEWKPIVINIQMRVSSKHLILASPTFRICLGSDTYSEGRMLKIEGNVVVPLPDEDPDVMIILLNIIHGLSSKVPRRVSLNMLSKIAVTVNHRQMHEAVELWSDTWIENLKRDKGFLSTHTPKILLSWLFIFWVFRKDEDFRKMSRILERESDDTLEHELETVYVGPHIPASIICTIQKGRVDTVKGMIAVIYDLITKYSGSNILCDNGSHFSCDANLLGSLVKASAVIGIWPRLEDPYPGINSKTLADQIREMQVSDGCDGGNRYYSSNHNHGIKDSIEASMRCLEDCTVGLHLTPFLPQVDKRSKKGKNKQAKKDKKVGKQQGEIWAYNYHYHDSDHAERVLTGSGYAPNIF